jgi:hypothetical protein
LSILPTGGYGTHLNTPTGAAQGSSVAVTTAPEAKSDDATTTKASPAVVVSLSAQAKAALAASATTTPASPSYYGQFFPTRDGFPAAALAAAVADPGAESSSAGKAPAQVAADARASMDANYAAMKASGKPFDYNSFEGKDWHALMGNLDRRSLNAVSTNSGGQFSRQEQDMAQSMMSQQQGLAMGLYSGPSSQAGKYIDPFAGDVAAKLKAGVKFLDGVSNDEKASVPWAFSRASAQYGYEAMSEKQGETPENLDSDSPLVRLIKAALDSMKDRPDRATTTGPIRTAEDLKKQPWFEGFERQLDAAIQQSQVSSQAQGVSLTA